MRPISFLPQGDDRKKILDVLGILDIDEVYVTCHYNNDYCRYMVSMLPCNLPGSYTVDQTFKRSVNSPDRWELSGKMKL